MSSDLHLQRGGIPITTVCRYDDVYGDSHDAKPSDIDKDGITNAFAREKRKLEASGFGIIAGDWDSEGNL